MATPISISDEQIAQYRQEGYFILESVIPADHLAMLREECGRFLDITHAEMEKDGTRVAGITHRQQRYFISLRYKESTRMREFIFSPLMAEICRAVLGANAYLFWEQFVIKGAEVGLPFAWHQDSGYLGYDHTPYMSCWCALDDVNETNGTVYVLPFSRAGTRQRQPHTVQEGTNDKVGYFGDDPGVPVIAPAGSIAVFSSVTFHRSGANTSSGTRRVYLAQYAGAPIMSEDGKSMKGFADPILRDGVRMEGT